MSTHIFTHEAYDDHEAVYFVSNKETGLKAIIALHSSALGPSLGGTRIWPYANEEEALNDVLRLSRGMTYKNALAKLPNGGGKAVIIADARKDKTVELIRAYAAEIEKLNGRYITGEDVGMTVADADEMTKITSHVRGTTMGNAGDPSPSTAYGVFKGMEAALAYRFGEAAFNTRTVSVQGLGNVGMALCQYLHEAGAKLIVSDIRDKAVLEAKEKFGAEVTEPENAHKAQADVYAPCALGAVLNETSIPEIKAGIVAGAANNQLEHDDDGARLRARKILYAPDYVINAGGVISITHEGPDFNREIMRAHVAEIGQTLTDIYKMADAKDIPTAQIADEMAEAIFKKER